MHVLQGIVDDKTLRVLNVFLNNPREFFHINKVANQSNVPLSTAFRIINNLLNHEFITYQEIGKLKIYQLAKNKKIRKLRKL